MLKYICTYFSQIYNVASLHIETIYISINRYCQNIAHKKEICYKLFENLEFSSKISLFILFSIFNPNNMHLDTHTHGSSSVRHTYAHVLQKIRLLKTFWLKKEYQSMQN